MPLSLSWLLLSPSNSCTCVLNDWRKARGTKAGGVYCRLAISGSTPHELLLGRCFWPKVAMKKRLPRTEPASSKRRIDHTGDSRPKGTGARTCSFTTSRSVTVWLRVRKWFQKWLQNGAISSSLLGWLSTKRKSTWAEGRVSGQSWTDENFPHL